MTLAATFLGGAKSRLLPVSVPFRFFATAAVFHVLMWVALFAGAQEATGFRGGLGPALAAVHLLTLGVLTMTAIGASAQLLPVATRRALVAVWPIKLVYWLFLLGLTTLLAGMYGAQVEILAAGAILAATGLLVFAVLLADNLRRATSLPVVCAYGWAALASLFGLTGLGLALAFDYRSAMLREHGAVALTHLILGGFGFMGLLAIGLSHVLIPMFALSAAPPRGPSWLAFALAVAAIAAGSSGALLNHRVALSVAAILGLAAAGLHLWLMHRVLASGMRKRLGLSFVLVRAAWLVLPLTVLVGVAALYDLAGRNGATLFGVLLIAGWLLTFLFGILQRILPFLASMHAPRLAGGSPAMVSELAAAWPLRLHAGCHGLALATVVGAVAVDRAALLRVGALIGLVGALAFAWFTTDVLRRLRPSGGP